MTVYGETVEWCANECVQNGEWCKSFDFIRNGTGSCNFYNMTKGEVELESTLETMETSDHYEMFTEWPSNQTGVCTHLKEYSHTKKTIGICSRISSQQCLSSY